MHQVRYSGKSQLARNLIELDFINYPLLKGGQGEWEKKAQGLDAFCSVLAFFFKASVRTAFRSALVRLSVYTLYFPSPGLERKSEEGLIETSPSLSLNHDGAETGK